MYSDHDNKQLVCELKNAPANKFGDQADVVSVVEFGTTWEQGDEGPPAIAVACVVDEEQEGEDRIYAADMRFNPPGLYGWHWFAAKSVPGGRDACRSSADNLEKWDLEGVMTHESGHATGIAYPYPMDDHPNLTMAGASEWCATEKRSLGLGDIRALRLQY